MPPFTGVAGSLFPAPTRAGYITESNSTGGIWRYDYANGTRTDCFNYANVTSFSSDLSCQTLAYNYGVNVTDLTSWNPSLDASNCVLDESKTYCVQTYQINSTDSTPYCDVWDLPPQNTTCDVYLSTWGLDIQGFSAWNPTVGSSCENWKFGMNSFQILRMKILTQIGVYYCVIPLHFKQANITTNCNQFYMAPTDFRKPKFYMLKSSI
jgi:hypothetical protein